MALYCPQGSGTLRQQLIILHILHVLDILHILHTLIKQCYIVLTVLHCLNKVVAKVALVNG